MKGIENCASIQEVLVFLMQFDCLGYRPTEKLTHTEEVVNLGYWLCGTANAHLVQSFINGEVFSELLENVAYNGPNSAPLMMRVCQLALEVHNESQAL